MTRATQEIDQQPLAVYNSRNPEMLPSSRLRWLCSPSSSADSARIRPGCKLSSVELATGFRDDNRFLPRCVTRLEGHLRPCSEQDEHCEHQRRWQRLDDPTTGSHWVFRDSNVLPRPA